jgi:N6-L-threonylcarbamoyladenine synthase
MHTILAIESSCDETAAAVCIDGTICSNIIATQSEHEQYGGVVPELASRAHMQNIVVVTDRAIRAANISINQIDAFAYTQSPGLLGSLLVGASFVKSLALATGKPLITVHHMQAHVLANLIPGTGKRVPGFPFLCLTVSGGHTQIILCNSTSDMRIIGETLDDAAGEAFDKSAKILGLPYPGGPFIEKYAASGNPDAYPFPEPQVPDLNFSFSGLKTSILYFIQKEIALNPLFIKENLNHICASIQKRIISILLKKYKKAVLETGVKHICIAGGVSANRAFRTAFETMGANLQCATYIPEIPYCTDNAAMIAITAYFKYLEKDFDGLDSTPRAKSVW